MVITYRKWLTENKIHLELKYARYKAEFKLDGGLPICERLTFSQWAHERFDWLQENEG